MKSYAPCSSKIGLHFECYDDFIRTPVIRKSVRTLSAVNDGHITVYLPAFDDAYLISLFRSVPEKKWELFSKHSQCSYRSDNVHVRPVDLESYTESLGSCDGLLTGGGFEAPAEALFLGKKLLMVPQAGQYEQQCNAAAAARLGVSTLRTLHQYNLDSLADWAVNGRSISMNYPDHTEELVREAFYRMAA